MAPSNRKSLNARKMEKNFIAVIEKGYTRQPALSYPFTNPSDPTMCHLGFITRELAELEYELTWIAKLSADDRHVSVRDGTMLDYIDKAMDEVADVSNTLDYCYERLMILEDEINGKKNKEE